MLEYNGPSAFPVHCRFLWAWHAIVAPQKAAVAAAAAEDAETNDNMQKWNVQRWH